MNSPLVCVTLRGRTAAEIASDSSEAKSLGADLVEVRLDYLWSKKENHTEEKESDESESKQENLEFEDVDIQESLTELIENIELPIIFTCRPIDQGGIFPGTDESRFDVLRSAIAAKPRWIDLETNIPEDVRDDLVDSLGKETQVIASVHYNGDVPNTSQILQEIEDSKSLGEIVKVCIETKNRNDGFGIFEAAWKMKDSGIRTSLMGLGPGGDWTRIHAPLLEQALVYTTTEYDPYLAQQGRINISDLQMAWSMLEYS